MTLLAVAAFVSLALVLGALWALYGRLGDRTEGFILATGGGALMFSAVLELIVPAQESKAYRRDHQMAGIATALGLLAAFVLIHSMTD